MSDAAAKTAALLKAMWEKNLPVLRERVAVLDRAAAAAQGGALHEELRVESHAVAHKLAGSLGMFGYPEGTRVARELEMSLNDVPVDAGRVVELAGALREILPL